MWPGRVWAALARLASPRLDLAWRFVNNKWNANFQLHQKIISARPSRRCWCCCCCCCCRSPGSVDILNNCCALGTLHSVAAAAAAASAIAFGGSRSKRATQRSRCCCCCCRRFSTARYDKNFCYPDPDPDPAPSRVFVSGSGLLRLCWVYSPFAQLRIFATS